MFNYKNRIGVFNVKVNSVEIEGIGGVKNKLVLEFTDGVNIICGCNGSNKTTILESIAHFFSNGGQHFLKKNALSKTGKCKINITDDNECETLEYIIDVFEPNKRPSIGSGYNDKALKVLKFNTHRDFQYKKVNEIKCDPQRSDVDNYSVVTRGVSADDLKNWLVNRCLFQHMEGSLSDSSIENLETAKSCFNVVDESMTFDTVTASNFDIMLNTPRGKIYFEYLSSGYKSCIFILLGIIKEIEYRFNSLGILVKDFDGIILIDEIDLHLHPTWQIKLINSLKKLFPNAQFIITTHSPHIIQSANNDTVIPLFVDENNDTQIKEIQPNEFGFQGWTIEEILKDVMGMEDTRSDLYRKTIQEFENAIQQEDYVRVKAAYSILDKMLHPQSYLKTVLRLRMSGVEEID